MEGSPSLVISFFAGAALLRVLVGYQPHSGQDNFHGASGAYGGDFEAQRHWMELTINQPIGDWYWYDLAYWGLDYPPLSAYQSWICGYLSYFIVGPESVALNTSRGYEDPLHKSFMRGTVVILDLLVYGTAAWFISRRLYGRELQHNRRIIHQHSSKSLWSFVVAMAQPAILLIDHGHFQYNTTALGFSLWALYFMSYEKSFDWNCIFGSVFFCLALSFKQMTLYYAPVVGCYLLGRCLAEKQFFARRFLVLALTVIFCFGSIWWPFVVYEPTAISTSALGRLHHVLRRIIPVQRGLFESKVSNLWCALSVRPIRLKNRIPLEWQPLVALLGTAVLMAPSCYAMFRMGMSSSTNSTQPSLRRLLLGTSHCALAFFLFSVQVHEKSILLALAPATFLSLDDNCRPVVDWFSVVATWTLWPLMVLDRLETAYVCTLVIFGGILILQREILATGHHCQERTWILHVPSGVAMASLHLAQVLYEPPPHLPDLFPVLWSIAGCGFCCVAYLLAGWHLHNGGHVEKAKVQ